jgi:hypothetical protein
MNEYALDVLVQCRIDELRAQAERWRQIRAARPGPRPMRAALGAALSRMVLSVRGMLW